MYSQVWFIYGTPFQSMTININKEWKLNNNRKKHKLQHIHKCNAISIQNVLLVHLDRTNTVWWWFFSFITLKIQRINSSTSTDFFKWNRSINDCSQVSARNQTGICSVCYIHLFTYCTSIPDHYCYENEFFFCKLTYKLINFISTQCSFQSQSTFN